MARRSRTDWLAAGMEVLATQGVDSLTIDHLAARLGVTKGSFYHHFHSQAAYRDALLAFWEQAGMAQIAGLPESKPEAWIALDRAVDSSLVGTQRHDPGMAIRFWATQDPSVRSFVERVDAQRLMHAEQLLTIILGDRERACFYGRMLYALVLGSGHVLPPVDHQTLLDFYNEFKRLVEARTGRGDEERPD